MFTSQPTLKIYIYDLLKAILIDYTYVHNFGKGVSVYKPQRVVFVICEIKKKKDYNLSYYLNLKIPCEETKLFLSFGSKMCKFSAFISREVQKSQKFNIFCKFINLSILLQHHPFCIVE